MPELRIVPWQPEHRATLDEILEARDELTGQVRDLHGADLAPPQWRRTVVAEAPGEAVAQTSGEC